MRPVGYSEFLLKLRRVSYREGLFNSRTRVCGTLYFGYVRFASPGFKASNSLEQTGSRGSK
jgi:hypothetical protein